MAPLRILHVIHAMNRAGAETMVMNLHRAIDPTAVRFDYLVHTQQKADYDDEIAQLGGNIYRVPMFTVVNSFSYRRAVRAFFAKHTGFDVVHGHMGASAPIYLDEARKMDIPTVAHSHIANTKTTLRTIAWNRLAHPVRNVADEFLACSVEAGIDRFGQTIVEGQHFHIVPNAIDTTCYACTNEQHLQAKEALGYAGMPLVGHIGRMTAAKNQRFLLEVFKSVLANKPQVHLLLLGDGPLRESLKKHAQRLGIAQAVEFCGVKDNVADYLKAMDVFVMPSHREGLPVVSVEAQATGLPCILSDAVSSEAALLPTTSFLPVNADCSDWAHALLSALNTPCDRSCGAASVAQQGYDIHHNAQWITAFYQSLASTTHSNIRG